MSLEKKLTHVEKRLRSVGDTSTTWQTVINETLILLRILSETWEWVLELEGQALRLFGIVPGKLPEAKAHTETLQVKRNKKPASAFLM